MIAMQKIDRHFDAMHHLLQMFDKYKNWPKNSLQNILLELAFVYFKKDRNLEESLKYFLEAIEINRDAKSLKHDKQFTNVKDTLPKSELAFKSSDVLSLVLRQPKKFVFNKRTCETAEKLRLLSQSEEKNAVKSNMPKSFWRTELSSVENTLYALDKDNSRMDPMLRFNAVYEKINAEVHGSADFHEDVDKCSTARLMMLDSDVDINNRFTNDGESETLLLESGI
ncbi:hypothetical protein TSAR_004299 [Trichomalopsis sarcophagae]|uniref:Uncharacterized protein n=1 Tax=Trichomalopsis sarcophagae TaxID=543379 RepID=A0A232EUQ7_9HYME|nr:hypothetical protein TSAR_004299 [Trichomalopsis sarcophagae]